MALVKNEYGVFLRYEQVRLDTFRTWPLQSPTPTQLPNAGFYYSKNGDLTVCAFCDVGIEKWEKHDQPWAEHEWFSPFCPLLRAKSNNIPLCANPLKTNINCMRKIGHDECGIVQSKLMTAAQDNAGEPTSSLEYAKDACNLSPTKEDKSVQTDKIKTDMEEKKYELQVRRKINRHKSMFKLVTCIYK